MGASRSESFGQRYSARYSATMRAQASSTELLYAFLKTSSSETDMSASTGGGNAAVYRYVCPANREVFIERVNYTAYGKPVNPDMFIGSTALAALSNGILVQVLATSSAGSTANLDFLDGQTITRNSDWGWLAGPDTPALNSTAPTGLDGAQTVRWTIGKSGFGLKLSSGQALAFTMQDDMSALGNLTEIRAQVQGGIFSST